VLVEEPEQQPFGPDGRVDQLVLLQAQEQRARRLPRVVLGPRHIARAARVAIAAVEVGLAQPLGRLGQELDQRPAGAPVGAARFAAQHLARDAQLHLGRDLLRLAEVDARDLLQ
jgi:hypothetical protein